MDFLARYSLWSRMRCAASAAVAFACGHQPAARQSARRRSSTAGGLVARGRQATPGRPRRLQRRHRIDDLRLSGQHVVDGLVAQRACPCRARRCPRTGSSHHAGPWPCLLTVVRAGGSRAAPDGGAAGGVGDVHMVAEQLGDRGGRTPVSAQPAQAPENSSSGCLNWLPLARVVSCDLRLVGDLVHAVVEHVLLSQLALDGRPWSGRRPGRPSTHTPQPMQSSGLMASVYFRRPCPCPS